MTILLDLLRLECISAFSKVRDGDIVGLIYDLSSSVEFLRIDGYVISFVQLLLVVVLLYRFLLEQLRQEEILDILELVSSLTRIPIAWNIPDVMGIPLFRATSYNSLHSLSTPS